MKGIEAVTSEGPRGPAYVRFSRQAVAATRPSNIDDEVIVDYDGEGKVIGIELVSLSNDTIAALMDVPRRNDLDLSGLLAHPFAPSSAA